MKIILPLTLAVFATAGLLAGTAAIAQPAPDRSLTRTAAEARAAAAFARLDQNSDGQLSPTDREDFARERFDAADADGNGQLSFAEAGALREQRRENMQERREQRGDMRGGRLGMRMMRGEMPGERLARADADNDGAISQTEFSSAALARFDAADADSDGTISAEERRAIRDRLRGEHRRPPAPRG